jgi:hypothetical protein
MVWPLGKVSHKAPKSVGFFLLNPIPTVLDWHVQVTVEKCYARGGKFDCFMCEDCIAVVVAFYLNS